MEKLIQALCLVLTCTSAFAHQDTIIKLDKGELLGLPKEYTPAYFDTETWTLAIAKNTFKFPTCIRDHLGQYSKEFEFRSSWYHTIFPALPPYLTIELESARFSIMISLETAKPIGLDPETAKSQDIENIRYIPLSESEICANVKN